MKYHPSRLSRRVLLAALLLFWVWPASAADVGRSLRYKPDGTDFVIADGAEFFNRPLYGGNRGFRIDAGDRPEFSLFLPGRGGNLRFGIAPSDGSGARSRAIWLHDARSIVARYRPGSMVYEIRDDLLGNGVLILTAIPMARGEGLVVRAELSGSSTPVKLIWAFGGGNGDPGRRNGDMGGEREPVSRFFQLKPEYCRGSVFEVSKDGFVVKSKPGAIEGRVFPGSTIAVADSVKWASPSELAASAGAKTDVPVVVGEGQLAAGIPFYITLQRSGKGIPASPSGQLPKLFADAESRRRALADRIGVRTPDPFINAAVAALSVAADAVWDEKQGVFMHGAVGWRMKLLGWRGQYAGDALGWHDRTRRHFAGFAAHQDTLPVLAVLPPADAKYNLARSETALQSNGDMSRGNNLDFYDMNLVAVDSFFRHLLWTGDLRFATEMWPVIERHFAWERRLFRRPFGPEKLPLYEAYCCIWASDDLMYSGGGVAHSSAYNYWHNLMAARVARLLGKDPSPFEKEAGLILKAMRRELWLGDRGWFAEYKDLLGRQAVHPSAGLWTFYHTLDSLAATPLEAWQMSRFVDTQLAQIPMKGPGVPAGNHTVATTDWMPYVWSVNNVALEESAHAALAYWQAGRADRAMPLLKGCLLDSMFMGLCPGNVGMTTPSDIFSGERYRDFADSVGATARAVVEGLFGILPDQLSGRLRIRPGFPSSWEQASIRHPGVGYSFRREGLKDSYVVESRLPKPLELRLDIAAYRDRIASVTVNGTPASWHCLADEVGFPRIGIIASPSPHHEVVIQWQGNPPSSPPAPRICALGSKISVSTGGARVLASADPQGVLNKPSLGNSGVEAVAAGTPGHRSAFLKVSQGDLTWWMPLALEIRPPLELLPAPVQDASGLRFRVRNNSSDSLDGDALIRADGIEQRHRVSAQPGADSDEILFPAPGLPPGSHTVKVDLGNGREAGGSVVNWHLPPVPADWEPVNIDEHFNDRVTRIFLNEYLSPRSPFCSLAIPKQGIGGWCDFKTTAEIDDSGLRAAAQKDNGIFHSPLGIPFRTPGESDAKNILFTSQWDNYPREGVVPLSGRASRLCLLMAGSTNPMQCRTDNGEVIVTYANGTSERLALHSPTNWWPIEQDFHLDNLAFARPGPVPPRLDLRTAQCRVMDPSDCKSRGKVIPGGAATVIDLPLDPSKELKSLTVRTLANDVVVGLMAATLRRDTKQ